MNSSVQPSSVTAPDVTRTATTTRAKQCRKKPLLRFGLGTKNRYSSPSSIKTTQDHHNSHFSSRIRPFNGIIQDIRARAPFYLSDWTDAYNYRVVPATLLIFFANVLPGIAFSLDLIETTNQYGVAEVLLSSFMAAFVFSVFGAQPLCIAGVTGPITVLNKTIFDILTNKNEDAPDYLQFVGWVYLWGAILHWITAALNWCNFLKYVTRFSCDTFGFFVSWVYLQYGIQVLTRQLSAASSTTSEEGAFVQITLALIMLCTCYIFQILSRTTLFHRHVRRFFDDYGMPISLVATTGLAYWGHFNHANPETLPISGAFQPANGRPWLVRFWELPGKWVGIAFPFGFVLWVLFFFDHNVSSLIAQGSEFPLRKPPGFHYDFFLLGVTTFFAGLLGIPAPNGLIPQAPIHTTSLLVMGRNKKYEDIESVRGKRGGDRERNTYENDNDERDEKGGVAGGAGGGRNTQVSSDTNTQVIENDGTVQMDLTDDTNDPYKAKGKDSANAANNASANDIVEGRLSEPDPNLAQREVPIAVVEQRVSNLSQGAMCLILLTGPFLHLLHLIPRGVLAGLFWFMGVDALLSNGITLRILYLLRDRHLTPISEPLRKVRKSRIVLFTVIQLIGFGATFAIVQTIASIGFPIIILLLVPLRTSIIPLLPFTPEELAILDRPTASPFTMESVGGSL